MKFSIPPHASNTEETEAEDLGVGSIITIIKSLRLIKPLQLWCSRVGRDLPLGTQGSGCFRAVLADTSSCSAQVLPQVEEFEYLGVMLARQGKKDCAINRQIEIASACGR